MKFEKYDRYIDSEIKLLGEMPNSWQLTTIKNIFRYFGSGGTPQSSNLNYYENGTISWLNTSDLKNFLIESTKFKITNLALREVGLKIYPANSIAVAMYGQGDTRGTPALLKIPTTTNQASCMMFKSFIADEKYILWWFISQKETLRAINVGATQPNMNSDFIKNLFISLPKKDTQIAIVNYLNTKTQKIDSEISILEQKIEKYKELKQTLIAETVLRGLDKNIELRDSETQWIGDIPKHWKTDRLKNIFNERAGKNLNIKTGEPVTSNILSVMKDIGVINHRDKGNVGNKMAEDITNYKLVYPNDIVVNKMNVMIGSVGISKEFGALSVIYIILITKKDSYAKYYDYFFRMKAFQKSLRRIATGILEIREAVNMTLFMQEIMTKPPYNEQVKIANYLDEKTSKIDSIVETIGKKIEILKEFRKTLINDVVTGKVKVA